MGQISDIVNPWRQVLLGEQASFRGVMFHVENGSRMSGRRGVVHEYPKRDDPYTEDMGRQVRRWNFSGYLIYRPRRSFETNPLLYDYVQRRRELYEALEAEDVARLVHPVFAPNGVQALCERYSMSESRERGGFTQFDMSFVEAGTAGNSVNVSPDTKGIVNQSADNANATGLTLLKV